MSLFTCEYCKKQFITNSTLRRHVRQFHKDASLPEVRRGRKPKQTSTDSFITCNRCAEKLINKKALIYHRKRKHGQVAFEKRKNSQRRALQFENVTDFNHWKCQEEDATMSQFVKAKGDRKCHKQTMTARAYYCNRSGRYIAKDGRLRHLKIQGTAKIGRMCPAAMFVKISSTGGMSVSYYPDHEGHTCDVAHIRLRRQQREAIAVKLAAGIPFDDILDAARSTASASGMTNMQFISKQDLANITRDYRIIKNQVPHKNDDISSRRPPRNVHQLMNNAQLSWAEIQNAVGDNVAAAEVVAEHMSRLRSLVAALSDKTDTPRLPPEPTSHEPVNKLAPTQRILRSTRKYRPKKRELTASKPSLHEKEFLLRTLAGNEPVISHQSSNGPQLLLQLNKSCCQF